MSSRSGATTEGGMAGVTVPPAPVGVNRVFMLLGLLNLFSASDVSARVQINQGWGCGARGDPPHLGGLDGRAEPTPLRAFSSVSRETAQSGEGRLSADHLANRRRRTDPRLGNAMGRAR